MTVTVTVAGGGVRGGVASAASAGCGEGIGGGLGKVGLEIVEHQQRLLMNNKQRTTQCC